MRLKLLGILAVCAAPVIASYLAYYVIKPGGRSNYGELIPGLAAGAAHHPIPLPQTTFPH